MALLPFPPTEIERLAALHSYEVLDTASEAVFDELVAFTARLTGSPIALISLLDSERQWFKARFGLDIIETPREAAFCAHTILNSGQPLVIEDATIDPRFSKNIFVTGDMNIRAYLGVPLVNPEGYALGSLCVIDRESKSFSPETIAAVQVIGRAVSVNLELRRSLIRTRELALTDTLTGLPNRRAVIGKLNDTIALGIPISVITLDLDYFKEVNDGEGHAAGDVLLQAAAHRLQDEVRPGDMIGRLGGDEFVILLIGVADPAVASEIASRITSNLPVMVPFGSRLLRLSATLGVAGVPRDADDAEMVMRIADAAMVQAKRGQRGSVGYASPDAAARFVRSAAILRAFDNSSTANDGLKGATVHLQPIIALKPYGVCGPDVFTVEALARWSHPDVGEVQPDDLFSVIGPERVARLGRVIREQALAAFASLQGAECSTTRLALNLSASEVARADVALDVAEQVERAGLSLKSIDIEITEEILLARVSDRTLDQLAALRGRGVRLVLDDFGAGNCGLAQLLRLPLDGVKLDKQFIQRLGVDVRAEEIIRVLVFLGHSLGLQVVAEGVETEHQEAILRRLGCDAIQGFFYAQPMTLQALKAWLDQRTRDAVLNLMSFRSKETNRPGFPGGVYS